MDELIDSARLSPTAAWRLLALHGLAVVVWVVQKRRNAVGGPISFPKALWLVFAVVLWFLVPVALWEHDTFWSLLFFSMLVRAVVEIPLCTVGKWKTSYGIAHDLIHLALVLAGLAMGVRPLLWLVLTGVTLIAEMFFVRLFKKATAGPENDVFFVPAGREYRKINTITVAVLIPTFGLFCWITGRSLA